MKRSEGRTSFAVFGILLFLGACSESRRSEVRIAFDPQDIRTLSGTVSIDGFAAEISDSGLIKNRSCYVVHAVADDLVNPVTRNDNGGVCSQKPQLPPLPGLGMIFGPVAYGREIRVNVPSGKARRFDLVGFINPYDNDPNCEKKLTPIVSANGDVRFTYGDYMLQGKAPLEGKMATSEPFGRLNYFAFSESVNLAPGPQTVVLKKLAWNNSKPEAYGCDGNSSTQNLAFVSPFKAHSWRESNGSISTDVINTGTVAGPMKIQCPPGVNSIQLFYSQEFYFADNLRSGSLPNPTYGSTPAHNLSCSGGVAQTPAAGPYLWDSYDPATSAHPTPPGSPAVTRWQRAIKVVPTGGDWPTTVFLAEYSPLYRVVTNPAATSALEIPLAGTPKFVGYRRENSTTPSNRYVYVSGGTIPNEDVRKFKIIPNSAAARNTFAWDSSTSLHNTNLISNINANFLSLLLGKTGTSSFDIFGVTNDNRLAKITFPSSVADIEYKNLSSEVSASTGGTLASDNGVLVSSGTGVKLSFQSAQDFSTSQETLVQVGEPGTVRKMIYDNPSAGTTTLVSQVDDAATTRFVVTRGNGTRYSWSPGTTTKSFDLLVGGGDPVLLAAVSDSTTFSLKRWRLTSSLEQELATPAAAFYPPLPATPSNVILRSLRSPDQGINDSQSALLYLSVTSGQMLYRTQDGGQTWFRVAAFPLNDGTITDIMPIERHDIYLDGSAHWNPGFLLLQKFISNGEKVRFLSQDWHGF
jgi:hypothetical protein